MFVYITIHTKTCNALLTVSVSVSMLALVRCKCESDRELFDCAHPNENVLNRYFIVIYIEMLGFYIAKVQIGVSCDSNSVYNITNQVYFRVLKH